MAHPTATADHRPRNAGAWSSCPLAATTSRASAAQSGATSAARCGRARRGRRGPPRPAGAAVVMLLLLLLGRLGWAVRWMGGCWGGRVERAAVAACHSATRSYGTGSQFECPHTRFWPGRPAAPTHAGPPPCRPALHTTPARSCRCRCCGPRALPPPPRCRGAGHQVSSDRVSMYASGLAHCM